MSAVQQGTLLEVLKKKMRAMKDELETAKEQAEDAQSRVMDEIRRREEVSGEQLALNRVWCFIGTCTYAAIKARRALPWTHRMCATLFRRSHIRNECSAHLTQTIPVV